MSILKDAFVRNSHEDLPDYWDLTVNMETLTDHENNVEPQKLGLIKDRTLVAELNVGFRCNDAQLDVSTRNAKTLMLHYIYREVLDKMNELHIAVVAHDEQSCMKIINEVRDLAIYTENTDA